MRWEVVVYVFDALLGCEGCVAVRVKGVSGALFVGYASEEVLLDSFACYIYNSYSVVSLSARLHGRCDQLIHRQHWNGVTSNWNGVTSNWNGVTSDCNEHQSVKLFLNPLK